MEERAAAYKELRQLADKVSDEKRDMTAEEKGQWDTVNARFDAKDDAVNREKRAIDLEARLLGGGEPEDRNGERRKNRSKEERRSGKPKTRSERRRTVEDWYERTMRGERPRTRDERAERNPRASNLALSAWFRNAAGVAPSEREMRAARSAGMALGARTINFELSRDDYSGLQAEYHERRHNRALSAQSGPLGGYTFGSTFVESLEMAQLQFGGMRQVAEVIRTESGEEMSWPTCDDTSNEGEQIGENKAPTPLDPTFGQQRWGAFKYSSKLIKVPFELFQDTRLDLNTTLGRIMGERLGRVTNRKFTLGVGGGVEPMGIVPASAMGKTTAGATAITADEILDLIHSVDDAYWDGASFMFHRNILLAIRKLKSNDNQYIWQPGAQAGVPSTLFGHPYVLNSNMQSSIATGTKTMLFGQLSKYKIRDVGEVRVKRLEERFADTDQIGFIAFGRHDGQLLDAGTRPVKHMLQV
jgi:HK97 family phage major capsid protein